MQAFEKHTCGCASEQVPYKLPGNMQADWIDLYNRLYPSPAAHPWTWTGDAVRRTLFGANTG